MTAPTNSSLFQQDAPCHIHQTSRPLMKTAVARRSSATSIVVFASSKVKGVFLKITGRMEQILGIQVHPGWFFFFPNFFGYPPWNQKKNGTWNFDGWKMSRSFWGQGLFSRDMLVSGRVHLFLVWIDFWTIFLRIWFLSIKSSLCGWCFLVCRVGPQSSCDMMGSCLDLRCSIVPL